MRTGFQKRMEYILGEQSDEKHGSLWLLTYADMITLILAFFVVLAAISDVNPAKLELVTKSTKKSLGSTEKVQKGVPVLSLDELIKAVQQIVKQQKLENQVEVTATSRGVVVSGRGAMFFRSGDSKVLPAAMPLLKALAGPINNVAYKIAVEGHTDNVPAGGIYPSNWELSSARASEIVRFMIQSGVAPERLRAVGLADTVPKQPNTNETNRAINRRIEIVFLTTP